VFLIRNEVCLPDGLHAYISSVVGSAQPIGLSLTEDMIAPSTILRGHEVPTAGILATSPTARGSVHRQT
jgi:hypothetical protein